MAKKEKLFGAYSGSLIARNFAEGNDEFHGYLSWNIENDTVEEVEIQNIYSFKDVHINQFTDFDDLDLEIENPTAINRVRIVWDTYSSTYTTSNLDKIRIHLNKLYNIKEIKNKKNFINETLINVDSSSDLKIEKISTQDGQHKLFNEFLEQIGIDFETINKVLNLDNEITSRLSNIEYGNTIWKPVKLSGKNFRSYIDFFLDFRDIKGILQILGKNQVGKTTAYSLISYVLFGNMIETEKRQKNGDNRFINNKIDEDYCFGSIVFEADNEYYGVKRYTKREWNRGKTEIKSVSTSVNYYKLLNPDDEFTESNQIDNLNEDVKRKTQKIIDNIVNSYVNFKRLALVTSDNLNEILKIDKSEFIDNILFNLGMDFFDLKLEELKKYKKEYSANNPKLVVNIESEENQINDYKENIKDLKDKNIILKESIDKSNIRLKKGEELVETQVKKLNKIDDALVNLNVENTNSDIKNNNDNLTKKRDQYKINNQKIKQLPESFDDKIITDLNLEYGKQKDIIYTKKDLINDEKSKISNIESIISKYKTENFVLDKESTKLVEENKKLEHSKTCPTCNQVLKKEDILVIKDNIEKNKDRVIEIGDDIEKNHNYIEKEEKNILKVKKQIENINKEIDSINLSNEQLLVSIGEQENLRKDYQNRLELQVKNETIKSEGEEVSNKIKELELQLQKREENLVFIEENKKIDSEIVKYKLALDDIKIIINTDNKSVINNDNLISNYNIYIKDIETKIRKFKKQVEEENIIKLYEDCVHRNGIPTLLLKKYSIPEINNTLNDLLKEVPFNVWLDEEDLTLKMCDINNTSAIIDCLSSSGKERTFAALSLKHCLNELNIKSKPSILILDEVTGKLIGESIGEFVNILSILKRKIDNIIIIEHVHDISPDHVMEVTKNDKGISEIVNII
jgi:DNA repair exonuclease SbcCD ATPase subunit